MKMVWGIFLVLSLLHLSACVEVRDNKAQESEPAPQVVAVQKFGDQVVDEVMYVYDGKILNAQDLEQAQKDNAYFKKTVGHDFEFHFDRLTITERGALYTLGNNVRLHVENLKTQSGLLSTFPENQTAALNQQGRAGGHILLDVTQGEGLLNIVMRGERGGKGLPGAAPDPSMKGMRGTDGRDGDSYGSNGICASYAKPGTEGGQGHKGHDGQQGAAGGDSGTLEIRIKNEEGFAYAVQRKPGRGGEGGDRGRGGEGGDNGNHGHASSSCGGLGLLFDSGKRTGPEGEPGELGKVGLDGVTQTVCINKSNLISCY